MCDPLTMAIVAGGGALLSAGVSYAGQQAMVNAQNKANDQWVAYQRQQAREAAQKDEESRQQADAARQSALGTLTPQSQQDTATTKAQSLNQEMLANANPAGDANVQMLSGQGQNSDTSVSSWIANTATDAARQARQRIQALANLQGYQGGYGSMMDTGQINLQKADQDIALASDKRKGDTAVLGVAQQVPVEQFNQGQNIAGSIANSLGGLAGSAFSSYMKK